MKKRIVLIAIVLLAKTMSAADFSAICSSGQTLYYHIFDSYTKTVLVTYPGANPGDYTGYERPIGIIDFPSIVSHGGTIYSVIGIGSYAFGGCSGITGVNFSNTIVSIGASAFANCGNTSLNLPESIESVSSNAFKNNPITSISVDNPDILIEFDAFYNTTWSNNHPDGVMYIGPVLYAYKGVAPENTTIQVMDNTRSIVARAFYQQRNIVSITFPNTINNIGYEAFYGCSNLSSVTLPQSLQHIGYSCFENCGSLSQVNYNARDCYFSDDINSSNYGVFRGCENFSRLVIGNNVKTIPNYLFLGCNHLSSALSIPSSVTKIEKFAFKDCDGITSVNIPKNLDTIGSGAFFGCHGLNVTYDAMNCFCEGNTNSPFLYATNITFGNNVLVMPSHMFANCEHLSGALDIPNTVTSIEPSAFEGCSGLSSITIGSNVVSIGNDAFRFCNGIVSVTISTNVESIGMSAFGGLPNLLTLNYNAICATVVEGAFDFGNPIQILNVGQGVKSIPDYLMNGSTSLEEVHLPSSLTSIGVRSFSLCSSLTSLTIPNSVASIGDYAFDRCTSLLSISLGNGLEHIGDYAFYGCSGLSNIDIPYLITTIGDGVFKDCSGLLNVDIPNSVNTIGNGTFNGCSGVQKLTIGTGVEAVGSGAFGGMYSLNELVFNAKQLNNDLGLSVLNPLTSLSIGSEVRLIPDNFLSSCQTLSGTLSLPSTLERIGISAFSNCGFSGELVLPLSLREIGEGAFNYCKFSSIKCLSSIPPIVDEGYTSMIFFGCWDKPLYVPNGCKNAYSSAAGWSNFTDIREMGTGLDENEESDYVIRIVNGEIVIDGIGDVSVSLYDVVGRCLEKKSSISTCVFSVPASGIYYVKIGNNSAQKVVVSR